MTYRKIWKTSIIFSIGLATSPMFGCSKFFANLHEPSNNFEMTGEGAEEVSENPESTSDSPAKDPLKNKKRTTREDFVDHSQEEGSLWASSGQTNYYFTKNKVRSPGDIVTVKVENDLYRAIAAEIKKSLTLEEQAVELLDARELLRQKLMKNVSSTEKDRLTSTSASPEKPLDPGAPVEALGPSEAASAGGKMAVLTAADVEKQVLQFSIAEVDISPRLEIKGGDMMMGEIVGRYPNGNYKIRATKKILYKKGQVKEVTVVAIVKAADIAEDSDAVNSGKLYDYQVEVAH